MGTCPHMCTKVQKYPEPYDKMRGLFFKVHPPIVVIRLIRPLQSASARHRSIAEGFARHERNPQMGVALYYSPIEEVPQQLSPLACFPEGDKRLIGHGWPEWRPKGDMTCLPCLCLRRMDELCRSSTGHPHQPHIPSTANHKTLNSYRVLIHSIRRVDRVGASRQPCPIKSLTPSG